jgi:multicomponent Na+:H+ antiporter subunit E
VSLPASAPPKPEPASTPRTALARGVAFFALWMVLMQSTELADIAVGALATCAATWLSLHLLASASGHLKIHRLLAYLPHFLWESTRAGIDVARRAFSPRLPLRTGFVDCPLDFPPGLARNTFATITSLTPGTVSADTAEDTLIYHVLDTGEPVAEALREEERRLASALVAGQRHE